MASLAQMKKTKQLFFFPLKPRLIADEDRNHSGGGPTRGRLSGIAAFDQTNTKKENILNKFNARKNDNFLGPNSGVTN